MNKQTTARSTAKAFLFDYDGVTTAGVNDQLVARRLSNNLGVSELLAAQWLQPIWLPLLAGTISSDQMWMEVERSYGQPIALAQRDIWFGWDELTPLPEMIELVQRLKTKGYPVGLLSNVTAQSAEIIKHHGGYDEFDFLVLSCDVGSNKPGPEIYQVAMEKLGHILPEDIVFLDDRESNVLAATSVGLKALLVTNHADTIDEVGRLIGR